MPIDTLAFSGTPSNSAATVVPAIIDKGALEPSDRTLLNDPEYMKQFHALSAEELPSEQQAILPNITPSKRSTKRRKTKTKVTDLLPDTFNDPDYQNDPVSPFNEDNSLATGRSPQSYQHTSSQQHHDEPLSGQDQPKQHTNNSDALPNDALPVWFRYYQSLCQNPDDVTQIIFWPVIYMYLKDHPKPASLSIEPTDNGSGVYGLRGSLTIRLREAFTQDVKKYIAMSSGSYAPVSRIWPQDHLQANSPYLEEAVKPNSSPNKSDPSSKAPSMVFKPQACEIIEDHLDPTPMESQA